MTRIGQWMQTYTGAAIWPLDPRPGDFLVRDIAHHLAMICRFGGATKWHYSVGQHSLLVAGLTGGGAGLEGLLHDAAEYVAGDMIRPIKINSPEYNALIGGIEVALEQQLGLATDPATVAAWRYADDLALAIERRDVLRPQRTAGPQWPDLPAPPIEYRIERMDPYDVEVAWLRAFAAFWQERHGERYRCVDCGKHLHADECL